MTRFDDCLKIILHNEGGLSDHKADRGGLTNYGVTQVRYSRYLKDKGLPVEPVSQISMEEVKGIYLEEWKACRAGNCPPPLDLLVFDSCVNHGPNRAIKLLQKSLGIGADGLFGKQTVNALFEEVKAGTVMETCKTFIAERRAFYARIIENDPGQKVFERGWENRMKHLEDLIKG